MEAQSMTGLPRVTSASLMRPVPPESLHRDPDLPERIFPRDPA
jgi:hypothetical protein